MKLQSENIFVKAIFISVILCIAFWLGESAAHMFYFTETFEYFLSNEPLNFMDAFLYHVPKYSLFIRLVYCAVTLGAGAIIGLLLERDHRRIQALFARERDYHEAVNAVNEGIFTYWTGSNKIEASTLCYSILGYAPNEVGNDLKTFYRLMAPEKREEVRNSLLTHIEQGSSFVFELKMKTKNGKWKWIMLKGNVQEANKDGSAKRIMGIVADITEQVETREKLEHYTACLEEAEGVAHVGHWEFNYRKREAAWSNEIFNILQLSPSSQLSDRPRKALSLIHPDDRRQTWRLFLKSIRENLNFDYTYRVVLKDKSIKYISQRGHHVFDDKGIVRSFGTIQDITQSSLATQALKNSEKRYRTLFDNVYQGIVILDRETRKVKLANKIFCQMLGYDSDEILQCSLEDLHPAQNLKLDAAWASVQKKPFFGNVDCLKKDGSTFHAEVYASNIVLERIPCIIGIFKDLTESYKVEYDRYMLKAAVDNSDVEIAISNPDGSIDYCSPALCRRLGYSSQEMKQMRIWDIDKTISKEDIDNLCTILSQKKTRKGESIQVGKDGTKFEISYVADYVKIGRRELVCWRVHDITESKRREAILENARQKAEESDRLKSIFLANISHEIRTPMNGILGFADLLQRDDLPFEKCRQYAKIISECGGNLMQLLNDILDISKIEAGEVEFKKEDFCINDVIEELYDFYEPQTRQAGKEVSLQMHKSLRNDEAVICSDRRYLHQILTNLLSNAIKFTERGGILMGYNAKRNGIEFFVKDSGEGIPADMLDKIFEPFRQGEEILSRKYHGSGLGLTIAKSYVEMLGGYMWVESEVGKGTTFYFTLPYTENANIEVTPSALPVKMDHDWRDKTLLIVEDNQISFMLLENILESTGASILHAETAQEGINMAENNDVDLVLMDVRLPDFTSWEASKIIKKAKPDLPIIVQTANANAEDKIKTFQAGCEAYLTKPIIKKQFYATLEKCLNKTEE